MGKRGEPLGSYDDGQLFRLNMESFLMDFLYLYIKTHVKYLYFTNQKNEAILKHGQEVNL